MESTSAGRGEVFLAGDAKLVLAGEFVCLLGKSPISTRGPKGEKAKAKFFMICWKSHSLKTVLLDERIKHGLVIVVVPPIVVRANAALRLLRRPCLQTCAICQGSVELNGILIHRRRCSDGRVRRLSGTPWTPLVIHS